ncbi:MAG: hypothetical protein MZV63_04115 [Marinilabiliales bacterium]|nr:hypothetical protein [Marinilabiliales bacterium]
MNQTRVYINRWKAGDKILYTVLNMDHNGADGPMFGVRGEGRGDTPRQSHGIMRRSPRWLRAPLRWSPVRAAGWSQEYDGTRRESSVDCIASSCRRAD